jgi:hypothetical protein
MKRYILLVVSIFIPFFLFAESTLSLGFLGNLGLMSGKSNNIVSSGYNITNLMNVEYNKSLLGIGANLTGKFSGSRGWGGMGMVYSLLPLSYTHDIKVSDNSRLRSSSEKTYTNLDPAFIMGFGGGVLKRSTFNEKLVLAIDLGPEIQFDIIGIDLYNLLIIGVGLFADVNLEYHINRHLFFDFGIDFKVLAGTGFYGYQQANIQVTTDEFMFFVSPNISIGFRF